MENPKVKASYFISAAHRDRVLAITEALSREYGVKVSIGSAMEKIIDAFYLPVRSLERSIISKEIATDDTPAAK